MEKNRKIIFLYEQNKEQEIKIRPFKIGNYKSDPKTICKMLIVHYESVLKKKCR